MTETKQEELKRPLPYVIYKGLGGKQGAFRFSLLPAYMGKRDPEGVVFMEAAATIDENKYDWENKIIFALSVKDIGELLAGLGEGKLELLHDPDAQTDRRGTRVKKFSISQAKVGLFFNLTEKVPATGEKPVGEKKVSISVRPAEAAILRALLLAAIPKVLGW